MKYLLRIHLNTSPEQVVRLRTLQASFAEVCNALMPIVRESRCWNRVALHHLAYRQLRERFPQIGSQMVCNAIYSVSRICRIIFQRPGSPWNIAKLGNQALPAVTFQATAPVYFDRHTLSLKNGRLSMYTLDGRMHFDIDLSSEDERRFHNEKLREIVLVASPRGYGLSFHFSPGEDTDPDELSASSELPEYLLVMAPEPPVTKDPASAASLPPPLQPAIA